MGFTSYDVDADKKFKNALRKASKELKNLKVPLTLIAKDFYKSEKAIFQLTGPGRYPDLAQSTIDAKERAGLRGQKIYPILKGIPPNRGRLEKSVTDPSHKDAINQIIDGRTLVIGTKVPYGVYHQSDKPRSKIPLRKFLFIGPESKFANSDQQGRTGRWINYLESYVLRKVGSK